MSDFVTYPENKISYDRMPAANQQIALDIFGRQQRGEITAEQARIEAARNEQNALQAVAAPTGTQPGRNTRPDTQDQGKPGASGDEAVCGPRPNTPVGPGQILVCNRQTRSWEVIQDPAAAYRPPSAVDPMRDPSRKPSGAPEGYDYEWNGTQWELKETRNRGQEQARAEQRESAKAIISNLLSEYGLDSLTDFVNNLITTEDIVSGDVILGRIRMTEQYKKRFAGNAARRAAGFNALSEAQYIGLENTYRQIMRASGLPQGFYDQAEDFNALIGGDVSAAELSSRVNEGYLAVQQANPQVITEMRRLYGVDDSMLAAYFLDPAKATPMLLRQARAAQIAGEATLQAEQAISAATAEELAVAGITQQQARQGFQTIGAAQELFVALPGTTEEAISQEEQIAGVFGTSGAAQQRIRQRSRERQAAFEVGGRFAGQGTTVTGLQ